MTEKTYNVEMKADIDIKFTDRDAAQEFFVDGDDWPKVFFRPSDLDELCEYIAANFFSHDDVVKTKEDTKERFICKDIESFNYFVKNGNVYTMTPLDEDEIGQIVVTIKQDLEVEFVTEL